MTQQTNPVPPHRTTLWTMLFVILIFLIGIVIRWPYVKKEASDAFKSRFSTEQRDKENTPTPKPTPPGKKENGMRRN